MADCENKFVCKKYKLQPPQSSIYFSTSICKLSIVNRKLRLRTVIRNLRIAHYAMYLSLFCLSSPSSPSNHYKIGDNIGLFFDIFPKL